MVIYMDPTTSGMSRWLHCRGCGFKGDTIEAYGRLNHIDDPRHALQRVFKEGLYRAPRGDVTPDAVDYYISNFPLARRQRWSRWEKVREAIRQLTPAMTKRLQSEHLWGGWVSGSQARLRRFLGGGTRRELVEIFDNWAIVPKRNHRTNLVLGYHDVPGRICAFQFIGENGHDHFRLDRGHRGHQAPEGGLAMLDALEPYERVVYAVNDPHVALMLHLKQFNDQDDPLKMVLFNQHTQQAWNAIRASRVVFWAPKLSIDVFSHVRQLGINAGYVTTQPNPRKRFDDMAGYISDISAAKFTARMAQRARPWPEAMARMIMEDGVNEGLLRGMAEALQFTHEEQAAIVDAFPSRLKDVARYAFDDEQVTRSAFAGQTNVIERADGWYAVRGSQLELISDAVIRLIYEIIDEDDKKIYWEGLIRFNGQELPFHEPADDVSKNTRKWVTDMLSSAGMGYPAIQTTWSKRLATMAQMFSAPRRIHGSSRLGVRPDGQIIFPNFTIRDGLIHKQHTVVRSGDSPAREVAPPKRRRKQAYDNPSLERSVYTASAAAFVAGMLSPIIGSDPKPVALVGPLSSVARYMMDHLARITGMRRRAFKPSRLPEVTDGIQQQIGRYGYPLYVDAPGQRLLRYWTHDSNTRLFMTVEEYEAIALACGAPWVLIYGARMATTMDRLPPMDDILLYLVDLQNRNFDLPKKDTVIESVLRDMCAWYQDYVDEDTSRYTGAARVLRPSILPGDAVIELFCHFLQRQLTTHSYEPFMGDIRLGKAPRTDKYGVLIDMDAKRVLLSRVMLRSAAERARLPSPDLVRISDDLVKRGLITNMEAPVDGWIVPLDFWERRVAAWQNRSR